MERISSKKLLEIRACLVEGIKDLLEKHNCPNFRTTCGYSPIVIEHPYDGNFTFTLDGIDIGNDDSLYFECSSSCENCDLHQGQIDLERLFDIYDWLYENEDELFNVDEGC